MIIGQLHIYTFYGLISDYIGGDFRTYWPRGRNKTQ